jgi:hypothetical protein
VPDFEEGKKKLLIYNSAFDNCSPKEGAQSGCGKNLQCNSYTTLSGINRWNCEPSLKAKSYRGIIYSQLGQTCGPSTNALRSRVLMERPPPLHAERLPLMLTGKNPLRTFVLTLMRTLNLKKEQSKLGATVDVQQAWEGNLKMFEFDI